MKGYIYIDRLNNMTAIWAIARAVDRLSSMSGYIYRLSNLTDCIDRLSSMTGYRQVKLSNMTGYRQAISSMTD